MSAEVGVAGVKEEERERSLMVEGIGVEGEEDVEKEIDFKGGFELGLKWTVPPPNLGISPLREFLTPSLRVQVE